MTQDERNKLIVKLTSRIAVYCAEPFLDRGKILDCAATIRVIATQPDEVLEMNRQEIEEEANR